MTLVVKKKTRDFVLCVAAALVLATASAAQENGPSAVVIEGGTLIDGTDAQPVSNAVIVIRGERISAAGRAGTVQVPAGAQRIDAKGKFIIPGLIDAHVHMRGWMNELLIAYGVTSVADADSPLAWVLGEREAIATGKLRGPRIYTAGTAFRCRLETCTSAAMSPENLRDQVRSLAEAGVDLIYVEQGFPPPALKAIIDEAHRHGLPVSGPPFYPREAVEYGIDALTHSYSIALYLAPQAEREKLIQSEVRTNVNPHDYLIPPLTQGYIRELLEKRTYLTPMLIAESKEINPRRKQFREENEKLLDDPELTYLPVELRQDVLGDGMKGVPPEASGRFVFGSEAPDEQKHFEQSYRNVENFLREYVATGGKVLAGDDPPHFVIPGLALHHELELLVHAGLSPKQALQAAGLWAAQFMRRDQEVGTIQPGRFADLLILDGDPLQNIRNASRINLVMKGGRVQDLRYHHDFTDPVPNPRPTP